MVRELRIRGNYKIPQQEQIIYNVIKMKIPQSLNTMSLFIIGVTQISCKTLNVTEQLIKTLLRNARVIRKFKVIAA